MFVPGVQGTFEDNLLLLFTCSVGCCGCMWLLLLLLHVLTAQNERVCLPSCDGLHLVWENDLNWHLQQQQQQPTATLWALASKVLPKRPWFISC